LLYQILDLLLAQRIIFHFIQLEPAVPDSLVAAVEAVDLHVGSRAYALSARALMHAWSAWLTVVVHNIVIVLEVLIVRVLVVRGHTVSAIVVVANQVAVGDSGTVEGRESEETVSNWRRGICEFGGV
jgi:hypothetical protein